MIFVMSLSGIYRVCWHDGAIRGIQITVFPFHSHACTFLCVSVCVKDFSNFYSRHQKKNKKKKRTMMNNERRIWKAVMYSPLSVVIHHQVATSQLVAIRWCVCVYLCAPQKKGAMVKHHCNLSIAKVKPVESCVINKTLRVRCFPFLFWRIDCLETVNVCRDFFVFPKGEELFIRPLLFLSHTREKNPNV